jgi:signal transduction histidine kinase
MGLGHRSIRQRIFLLVVIPILSLTGLYVFAVSITAHDALLLARSRTVKNTEGLPTGVLQGEIEAERLLAVVYLARPAPRNLAALQAQEGRTDKALRQVRAAVTSSAAMSSASRQEKRAVGVLLKDTSGLGALRTEVTSRTITRARTNNAYTDIFDAADLVLNQLILQETNVPLAAQGLELVSLGRSEEMLLEEDTLLTGDMAARSFTAADRQQFTRLVGARRALYAQTLPELDPVYRSYYTRDVRAPASAALTALENSVSAGPAPHGIQQVSPASWAQAVGAVAAGLTQAGKQAADKLTLQAQPAARATYLRLIVAGGLGLLAILVSVLFSILIGRGLIRQLAGLRESALELANVRLPGVVQRLRAGQEVDVAAEAPPLEPSADEFGQVRQAFNAVQRTAIEAAVDEAKLRRGISDVFRNLARRSQSLLHRQLALLDGMERRASGPEELENLFRIDHLTTRMRRHAEGLIILSGESPGRGWRHPVPLVDVLRAAVAEVEDYTRIRVVSRTQAALAGPAVADVIHLVAELAENATIFSPPNTPVRILGDVVGRGFAVEIEDRGLGIADEKLAEINHNLAVPPQFDLSGSDRLGLFIAGQLASRHDIKITLRTSPYGGTTAIVLIPSELVVEGEGGGARQLAGPESERAVWLAGRHAALDQDGVPSPLRIADASGPATTELPAVTSLAAASIATGNIGADSPAARAAARSGLGSIVTDSPAGRPAASTAAASAAAESSAADNLPGRPAVPAAGTPVTSAPDASAPEVRAPEVRAPVTGTADGDTALSPPPGRSAAGPVAWPPADSPSAAPPARWAAGIPLAAQAAGRTQPGLLPRRITDSPPPADLPVRPTTGSAPSPDLPVRPTTGSAPSPDLPVRPTTGSTPSPDLPVRPTTGSTPSPDLPVRPTTGSTPSPDLPVRPTTGSTPSPDLPVRPIVESITPAEAPGRRTSDGVPAGPGRPPAGEAAAGHPQLQRPHDLPSEPAGPDQGRSAAGSPSSADPAALGLPIRIRQASLAPQLRDSGAPAPNGNGAPPPPLSPEAARNTMAALQRGWERGRSAAGAVEPDAAPDPAQEPDTGELSLDGTQE